MSPAQQTVQARAEILKLARLLHCSPERLDYLEAVPPEEIRQLRDRVTDLLFDAHDATLSRLVAASRLLPVALVALMGERAFGPMLSARLAGRLDPERAVEAAARLSAPFLAEVAVELDPRRAKTALAGIPPDRVAEVTRELARRGEFVAMGRLVGYLPPETLAVAVTALTDGELLRAAFVMEEKERVEELAEALGEQRLEAIIEAAEREDLWVEAIDLLGHLGPERQAALVEIARERLGDDRQAEVLELVREAGLLERPGPLRDLLTS